MNTVFWKLLYVLGMLRLLSDSMRCLLQWWLWKLRWRDEYIPRARG